MSNNNEFKQVSRTVLSILMLSCLFYAPITVIINTIQFSINYGMMLSLLGSIVIYILCFLVASIFIAKKKLNKTIPIASLSASIYTIISTLIIILTLGLEDGALWNLYSMLLTLDYSVLISVMVKFLKFKHFIIYSAIYFIVNFVYFSILTLGIAKYGSGNKTIIILGIYTGIYLLINTLFYFIKKSFQNIENEEKEYQKQFE